MTTVSYGQFMVKSTSLFWYLQSVKIRFTYLFLGFRTDLLAAMQAESSSPRSEGLDNIFCSFTMRLCQWKKNKPWHKLNEWSPKLYLSCSVSVSLQSAGDSVCFMSLRLQHHDSVRLRHSECHLMTLLHGPRNWVDQPRWLLWTSCLDCRPVLSATLHPLKFSKDCNVSAFRQLGAYLRRSTGLYLATSGCIVLIFLWTFESFL